MVNLNMAHLFVELLKDSLSEYSYPAKLAQLNYDLSVDESSSSINVMVSGYTRVHELLNKIFEKMASFKVDEKRFKILKDIVSIYSIMYIKKYNVFLKNLIKLTLVQKKT